MQFASARIITHDVDRLTRFYERLLGRQAVRPAPAFALFPASTGTLAIGAASTVPVAGFAERAGGVIVEFQVDSAEKVDRVHDELSAGDAVVAQPPTWMPWGNRSLLVEDPDGNLVNVFALAP